MATSSQLEARIKAIKDWDGLRALWQEIADGQPVGWEPGEALEHLVIRAFELDPEEPATVRYPYEVELFNEKVEEIDGAVHLHGLTCLVESKEVSKNVAFGPIAKLRSQLLRRPAGTVGLLFSRTAFTEPTLRLAHFTMPQAILLWPGIDIEFAMREGRIARFLRIKYRVCCEEGIPEYTLSARDLG